MRKSNDAVTNYGLNILRNLKNAPSSPNNQKTVQKNIAEMRMKGGIAYNAPVDTIGCSKLADKNAPLKVQRYQVLVSLMLSSKTRDQSTAQAFQNLKSYFEEKGLEFNPYNFSLEKEETIKELIVSVGFYRNKAKYLLQVSKILCEKYDGDIPNNMYNLCLLPGVGAKMGGLAMQCAQNDCIQIPVDTHVQRIAILLQQSSNKSSPNSVRNQLESWLPRKLQPHVNQMLVGFGQTVCSAKAPKCHQCKVSSFCSFGKTKLKEKMQNTSDPLSKISIEYDSKENEEFLKNKFLPNISLNTDNTKNFNSNFSLPKSDLYKLAKKF